MNQSNFLNNIQEESGEAAALSHNSAGKRSKANAKIKIVFIIYEPQNKPKKFISDSLNSANRWSLC